MSVTFVIPDSRINTLLKSNCYILTTNKSFKMSSKGFLEILEVAEEKYLVVSQRYTFVINYSIIPELDAKSKQHWNVKRQNSLPVWGSKSKASLRYIHIFQGDFSQESYPEFHIILNMTLKWTCKLQTFFFIISPLGGITLHAQKGILFKICHQTPTVSFPAEYILLSILQWEENIIFFVVL